MIGQIVDYNIEVDDGKSKHGIVISYYTGLLISISEYGSLVFHNGSNQKIIYTPQVINGVVEPAINVTNILTAVENAKEELLLETDAIVEGKLEIDGVPINENTPETVFETTSTTTDAASVGKTMEKMKRKPPVKKGTAEPKKLVSK